MDMKKDTVDNKKFTYINYTEKQVEEHSKLWAKHTPNGDELLKQGCYFDYNAARRVRYFFKQYLRIKHKNKTVPFILARWQRRKIVSPLFGWKNPDGTRVFRTLFLYIPKKNGKSTLCAGMLLYLLIFDGELAAKVFAAAGDKEQADIIFSEVVAMARLSKRLKKKLKITESYKKIKYKKTDSLFRALSSEAHTKEGLNAHAYVVDELHILPNNLLLNTLQYSGRARLQPVAFKVTTAGCDLSLPWYEEYKYAKKVLAGEVKDITYLPVIYEIEQGQDVEDRALWFKANPSLGTIFSLADMEKDYIKAKETPIEYASFLRYMLNYIVTNVTRPLSSLVWMKAVEPSSSHLAGRICYGGLDLASVRDLVAFSLVFPFEGYVSARFWYWVPKHVRKNRELEVIRLYDKWHEQGFLKFTDSEVADYDVIFNDTVLLSKLYKIRQVNVDKSHNAMHIIPRLHKARIKAVGFAQSVYTYNSPCKEFEVNYTKGLIRHDGNPVTSWCLDNLEYNTDPAGRVMPDKMRSREKIDGMMAFYMAYAEVLKHLIGSETSKRGIVSV